MSEEFHEGDLVQAAKGRQYIVGYLNGDRDIVTENVTHTPAFLRNNGWTVTVIEKAAPKLPTEPGSYSTRNGEVWALDMDGEFKSTQRSIYLAPDGDGDRKQLESAAPFTRLEPVPVTAKKVLDAIRQRIGSIDSAYDFQAVATQFGVSE